MSLAVGGKAATLLCAATVALVAAGCGSSSDSNDSSAAGTAAGASTTTASSSGASGVAAATAAIAPFETKPSAFNITQPLKSKPPKGATLAYMQCGAPECAELAAPIAVAAKELGMSVKIVKTGATAGTIAAAFNSAIQLKPDAVLVPALDPITWTKQLNELNSMKIPVVAWTIPQQPTEKFAWQMLGGDDFAHVAELQADYVISKSNGKAVVSYYYAPEYTVFDIAAKAFKKEIEAKCPGCKVDLQQFPASSIGTGLPGKVVSYLQQHPDTNWIAFAFGSPMAGVPQALSKAGLTGKVQTITQSGSPAPNYQYLKSGQQTVDLATSKGEVEWGAVDAAARAITGQANPVTKLGDSGLNTTQTPIQFLTKDNLTFDSTQPWEAYPDFKDRFRKLWVIG
jgi:ribose transport system substrate-binding protein